MRNAIYSISVHRVAGNCEDTEQLQNTHSYLCRKYFEVCLYE